MGMFEQFEKAAAIQAEDNVNTRVTFTFKSLPKTFEELEALPQSSMRTPFMTAALTILALCRYSEDTDSGTEMLNFLRGPRTLSEYEISFMNERFDEKKRLPFSYLKGSAPENDFSPSFPYSITVYETQNSYANEGYAQVFVNSSYDSSTHQITLRWRNEQWLLWEQYVLIGIHPDK